MSQQRTLIALIAAAIVANHLLAARAALYATARQRHPARWSRQTRDWTLANDVYLNPERPPLKKMA